jgi:hypothetical protein
VFAGDIPCYLGLPPFSYIFFHKYYICNSTLNKTAHFLHINISIITSKTEYEFLSHQKTIHSNRVICSVTFNGSDNYEGVSRGARNHACAKVTEKWGILFHPCLGKGTSDEHNV